MEKNTHDKWHYLFSPDSVAVIGASNTPGSWGCDILQSLLCYPDRRIYPVNPSIKEVLGLTAFATVSDIPEPVDLAVIKLYRIFMLEICKASGIAKHSGDSLWGEHMRDYRGRDLSN